MPVTFPASQFSSSNILIFDSQGVGRTEFISNVKDADAAIIEDGDAISNNVCVDTIKTAGYRQVIMALKGCKTENKYVLPFDYMVVFNNKHMGWRDDIYYNYSLQRVFEDFEEFSQTLDKLEDYECLVISASEGSARRFTFRRD
jgi:hypothetical protein